MPQIAPPLTISNNKVIVAWIFMAVWLSFLGCFTYLFVTAGAPPEAGVSGWAILAMFWVFGLGATRWVLAQPRIRVTVTRRELVARQSWLWRARERRYRVGDLAAPDVVAGKDSDGDPYFKCELTLPGGDVLTVAEAHARAEVEAVQQRLAAALAT